VSDKRRLLNLCEKVVREFNDKFGTATEPADVMLRCRFAGGFVCGSDDGLPDWEAQVGNMFAIAAEPELALVELCKKVKAVRKETPRGKR